jgi:hypothetical protein
MCDFTGIEVIHYEIDFCYLEQIPHYGEKSFEICLFCMKIALFESFMRFWELINKVVADCFAIINGLYVNRLFCASY